MNQIEVIKAEIERRLKQYDPDYVSAGKELKALLSFIESLEQEQFAGETMMENDKIDTGFTRMMEKEYPKDQKIKGWVVRDPRGFSILTKEHPNEKILHWLASLDELMVENLGLEKEPIEVELEIHRI